MALSQDTSAPYAPTRAILDILDRHRSRGLPSPVDKEVLGRAGVSESLISRTLQALHVLDLIDEDGAHSETLERLRLAPEAEYRARMVEWLNAAYADILQYVDPADGDETAVRDAFRPFRPHGMQDRMVTLFTGLYSAAGIWPEKAKAAKADRSQRLRVNPTPRAQDRSSGGRPPPTNPSGKQRPSGVPEPIEGLLSRLPDEGHGWTKERRDLFVSTFGAVLDFCFPIVTQTENEAPAGASEAEAGSAGGTSGYPKPQPSRHGE